MAQEGSTPTRAPGGKLLPAAMVFVVGALFAAGVSPTALAHEPVFADSQAGDPLSAPRFSDPAAARVIYFELSRQSPVQWFSLDNDKPRELSVKLGVPAGVSRQPGAPAIVWFGPALPQPPSSTGIEPPPGSNTGAAVLPVSDDPERFYEPVTGTESRIFVDARVQLPSTGTYYGAVFDAEERGGKVWVGVGQQERFSWRDAALLPRWIEEVRNFHEVPGWPRWAWIGAASLLATGFFIAFLLARRPLGRT